MEAAVDQTGLDDFGSDDFIERLDILCRALRDEARPSEPASWPNRCLLTGLLRNRLLIEDLIAAPSRDPRQ